VVGLGEDDSPEGVLGVVVAIDGPAGSGKSTVARRVAEVAGRALGRRRPRRLASRRGLRLPRPIGWVRPAVLLAAGLGGRAPPTG